MTKRVQRGKHYVNGGVITEHISYMNGDDKRETIISKQNASQGLLQVVPGSFDSYKKTVRARRGGINSDYASMLANEYGKSMKEAAEREQKIGR